MKETGNVEWVISHSTFRSSTNYLALLLELSELPIPDELVPMSPPDFFFFLSFDIPLLCDMSDVPVSLPEEELIPGEDELLPCWLGDPVSLELLPETPASREVPMLLLPCCLDESMSRELPPETPASREVPLLLPC